MTRLASLALLLAGALAVTGCSGDPGPGPDGQTDRSRDIDARAYYEEYESPQVEYDGAAPAPSSVGHAEDGAGEPPRIPDPDEDNTFVDPGTSGFVRTADDPRSTFGLDVDAGSFNLARSSLSQGYPVPPASVRPEEWVNALPYDETQVPTSDADLSLVGESGPAPSLDDGTQVVRVAVAAREVPADTRPRVNITLVVDRSGSMDIRERLGLVQSSLAVLANQLRDDDTVSVVSFEDRATPLLGPTPVRETRKILRAIERLTPGGSTNLEAGLSLGYEQAREAFDPDAVNLVVLCSDGVANVGSTGPGSITERIAEEGADGIHLVTVGYGLGNYNDHLMEQLANLGDGFYAYVDTYDEAQQLFGTDLTTTLVPVAGEARAQVTFDPALVSSYRLIGYENREIADDDYDDLDVDAGELGSGHRATALYEVTLADGVDPGAVIGSAAVTWFSTATARAREVAVDLLAADPETSPSGAWELAVAAADAAQLVQGRAPFAGRGVDLDDLRERVDALARDGVGGADELAEVLDLAAGLD